MPQTVKSYLIKELELFFIDGSVRGENFIGKTKIKVASVSGEELKSFSGDYENASFSLSLAQLRRGGYVVQYSSESG